MPLVRVLLAVAALAAGAAPVVADEPTPALVAKRYQLDLVTHAPGFPVATKHGPIDGAAADPADLESYTALFACEWSLYPPELVRRTGLKRVVFCKNLHFNGQRRTAIPDFEHDALYFDVTRGRHDDQYVRRVIHHEFFHVVDLKDDGKLYADERWANLNPPGFRYGPGGARLQDDPTVTTTGKDVPGFVNRYAASGVEEDKAELFSHLLVEPETVAARAEKDKYVRAKVERMKELMAAFSTAAGAEFWDAAKTPRPTPKP
jgi:hypothetical protein